MHIKHGFSIIELLVVIGIMAILAAILLPAISSIRQSAKQTTCINNQRQCILAIISYSVDWDGLTPPAEGAVPPNIFTSRDWHTTLFHEGYLPEEQVSSYDLSSGAYMVSLRIPNVACCPVFKPLTNPTGPYTCTNYGVRWDLNPAWTGIQFGTAGVIPFSKIKPNMPYLADTIYTTNRNRAGAYWVPDIQVNTIAINLAHRRRAIVSYSDGRAEARDNNQLVSERVLVGWLPP